MQQDSTNTSSVSGGISFSGLLTIAFIILKLVGVISWSWWIVLLPLWGPVVLVGALFVFALLVVTLSGGEWRVEKTRKDHV